MKIRKTINFFVVGLLLLSSCVYAIDPPNLLSPENGHEHIKLDGQVFDWSDVSDATSYRIVVADNSAFSGFNDTGDSNTNCNQRCKTERTTFSEFSGFSGLKENVRYYWKVRSNTSGWSNVYSFTPKYGAVRAVIYPTELRDRAKFQVVTDFGGIGWESSGKIVSQLNYESVQIEFSSVDGWKKPQNKTIKVIKGQIESVSGTYEKSAAGIPDLIIDVIILTKSKVTENETFDITANVKNIGSGASAASTLRLYRSNDATISSSDTQLNARAVSSLSENGNQNLSYSGNIGVAGTYYIGACVDTVVGESSTTNNCSSGKEIVVTKKNQQINGVCGTANNHQFSYSESAYGTYKQCSSGTSNNTKFPEEGKSVTWSCIAENGGSSADCSASKAANPNNQSHAPVLKNTKNLEDCSTAKTKCVKVNQTVTLKFDITDINNNISKLQVDWNGDGKPEYSEDFSGGQASTEASYNFSSTDIQGCPNNADFRNDGICWKKNVTLTATAYDDSGNASNVFSQGFILYDLAGYQKAVTDLKATEEERKILNDQIKAEQLNQQQATSNESSLQLQCSAKQNIDGWKTDSLLKPTDPFSSGSDAIGIQRKSQQYVIKCADGDPLCKNGNSYKIVVAYNHEYFSPTGSINYPAKIESFVIDLFKQAHFETAYVNNLSQKDAYIKSLVYKLKNEISARSGNNNLTCNADDFREWSEERWKSKIRENSEFKATVEQYALTTNSSYSEASKGVVDGTAKALREIAQSYLDLASDPTETIGSILKGARDAIASPQATKAKIIAAASEARDLAQEIAEAIPLLPDSMNEFSAYDKAYFSAYVTTFVAHELAPTGKLKLLKSKGVKPPKWLNEATLLVNLNQFGVKLNRQQLIDLDGKYGELILESIRSKQPDGAEIGYTLNDKSASEKERRESIENNIGLVAQKLGKAGEASVKIYLTKKGRSIGDRKRFDINGHSRISDGFDENAIIEVKNTKSLGLDSQIKDYVDYVTIKEKGLRFELYVRKGCILSKPLMGKIEEGKIVLFEIEMQTNI